MESQELVEPWEEGSADGFGLLEPAEVEVKVTAGGVNSVVSGWRFLREPNHPYLEDIPAGSLLFKTPGLLGAFLPMGEPWTIHFGGKSDGVSEEIVGELFEADRLLRDPIYRSAMALPPCAHFGSAYVESDLGEIDLRRGDILLRRHLSGKRQAPPRAKPFSRGDLGYLRNRLMVTPGLITSLTPDGPRADVRAGVVNRQHWSRAKDAWRPHVFRWRPSDISQLFTIQAGSDESALFELIHSAGCRMPRSS